MGFDAFATITDGVNGVANPGTVIVYAGTYAEGTTRSTLPSRLLYRAQRGQQSEHRPTRRRGGRHQPGYEHSPERSIPAQRAELTVTIEGLKFDGTPAAMNAYADHDTISLKKNIFTASHDRNVLRDPNLTIDDNRFVDIAAQVKTRSP